MKIKLRSRLLKVFKRIINIRSWFDWDRMKAIFRYLLNGFKKFFVPQKADKSVSFDVVKKQLNLSDMDLLARQKGLLRLSILMFVIAVLLFIYVIYLFISGGFVGGFLGFVVVLIALALAFRYHFWYFQIREQKLGCTFKEWFRQGLMGDK